MLHRLSFPGSWFSFAGVPFRSPFYDRLTSRITRRYIRTSCSRAFSEFMAKRDSDAEKRSFLSRIFHTLGLPSPVTFHVHDEERSSDKAGRSDGHGPHRVRPDMIRRTDNRPMLINPSGLVTGETPEITVTGATPRDSTTHLPAAVERNISINSSVRSDEYVVSISAICRLVLTYSF